MSKKKRKKRREKNIPAQQVASRQLIKPDPTWFKSRLIPASLVLVAVLGVAYFTTISWMVGNWQTEPDYSHGFLIIPLALTLAYYRLDRFPGILPSLSWGGLSLVFVSIGMRIVAFLAYAEFLDAWSIIPLLLGTIWFLLGRRAMLWSAPAVLFLFLMVPLPYRIETMMSWRLQGVATTISTILLRVFGIAAVAEGHVIWVNGEQLLVEQACSGLRIFVGMGALACFWALMADRSWIDRVIILAAAIPLAVLANALRITLIGLFYTYFSSPDMRHLAHAITGIAMIPAAFGALWCLKKYWEHLYRPLDQMTARETLKSSLT